MKNQIKSATRWLVLMLCAAFLLSFTAVLSGCCNLGEMLVAELTESSLFRDQGQARKNSPGRQRHSPSAAIL